MAKGMIYNYHLYFDGSNLKYLFALIFFGTESPALYLLISRNSFFLEYSHCR
jgi:hypothetical protein